MKRILLIGVLIQLFPLSLWAASCATVDTSLGINAVAVTTTPVGECTGFVILSSEEWGGASIWLMPTVDDVSVVWASAFILPMSLFLFSWAVGRLVKFFRG